MNTSTHAVLDAGTLGVRKVETTYDADLVEGTMLESPHDSAQDAAHTRLGAPAMTMHSMPLNIGNTERIISLVAGALGLFFLSRRLLISVLLTAASIYLFFRGLTGYCSIYQAARIDGRRFKPGEKIGQGIEQLNMPDLHAPDLPDVEGAAKSLLNKVRPGAAESREQNNGRSAHARTQDAEAHDAEAHDEEAHDDVEEASWESFPASDPPASW